MRSGNGVPAGFALYLWLGGTDKKGYDPKRSTSGFDRDARIEAIQQGLNVFTKAIDDTMQIVHELDTSRKGT
eukprot:4246285-Amphidinium_carterae.2